MINDLAIFDHLSPPLYQFAFLQTANMHKSIVAEGGRGAEDIEDVASFSVNNRCH
jgi:hypothetical protein